MKELILAAKKKLKDKIDHNLNFETIDLADSNTTENLFWFYRKRYFNWKCFKFFWYEAALTQLVGLKTNIKKELVASRVLSTLSENLIFLGNGIEEIIRKGYIKDGVIYINEDLFSESTLFHDCSSFHWIYSSK